MNGLTKHQEEKFDEVVELVSSKERRILLMGNAGVGKTWLLNVIVDHFTKDTYPNKILCSAPTHKALRVIRDKVSVKGIKFSTIHSALHYKGITDRYTGEKVFVSVPNMDYPPLKGIKYWIIDESSMIDTVMLGTIEEWANTQGVIVIFVGDEKQINPVGEDDSPVFHQGYPEVELTEIIRQGAGNPIIKLSRNLPFITTKVNSYSVSDTGEPILGFVHTQNMAKVIEKLAEVNGTDEFKYLAWTNKEVDKVNAQVRHRIYGETPAKIELGETIVMNSPYGDYTTNEEIKVEELHRTSVTIDVILESSFRKVITETATFNIFKINDDIMVLDDSSIPLFKRLAAMMGRNCREKKLDFKTRNAFLDTFADFKYNHALTVHKSQGSTYETTVLNVGDINFNRNLKEKQRLLYTGITRASKLLILYNV